MFFHCLNTHWEKSLCSPAREREKRNMKCFPGSSVLSRGHKTSTSRTLLSVIEGCRQTSSSEPNLGWHQPGVLGFTQGWMWSPPQPRWWEGAASASPWAPLMCIELLPGRAGSHRLSWSGREKGSSATLNQHGWLQSAQIWPSYQLLFQDISSS